MQARTNTINQITGWVSDPTKRTSKPSNLREMAHRIGNRKISKLSNLRLIYTLEFFTTDKTNLMQIPHRECLFTKLVAELKARPPEKFDTLARRELADIKMHILIPPNLNDVTRSIRTRVRELFKAKHYEILVLHSKVEEGERFDKRELKKNITGQKRPRM